MNSFVAIYYETAAAGHKKPTLIITLFPSYSQPQLFFRNRTVTVTDIYHFAVLGTKGCYYAKKNVNFKRVVDLLEYYRDHDYENHLDIANIRLVYPLLKPDYDESMYSYASVEGRFENLLAHLRQLDEETGEEVCECGLIVKDAILPNGWMLHQTTVTEDKKKYIFFQNNTLNLTQWDIPDGLWSAITPNQRRFIHENQFTGGDEPS